MAKQHFYSCVPAKMSLFNRMDGYDTFAHSDGVTAEMIEKLNTVFDIRPTKEDAVLIRNDALPTVYCQFNDGEGGMIQSAVSFIKSDYTGERSSFMVHSLFLNDKEKTAHFESIDAAPLNPAVFKKDLSDFDLTAPDATPVTDCPEVKVPTKKPLKLKELTDKYDTGMVKRLIYSLISITCGKTKALYLGLPSKTDTFSSDCLDFLNAVMQIFPYNLRKQMSFVTYVSDIQRFSSFKIKCISEDMGSIPTSKGITVKMGGKEYEGISDQNIAAYASVIDFFYGLIGNDEVRNEFIEFCEYAIEKNPSYEKLNMKTLEDLVFVFRYLSGKFDGSAVLCNDDAVYNFVAIYDKNREFIKDEYRAKAMKCLTRYPENHAEIPKNVFSKVSNMYSTETDASRSNIMTVVLELIHTDVMRDKLFGFIKSHYDGETREIKSIIMQNLCRVYYGGFLQEQILNFFKEKFENEPEDIRELILEKLFLTVRTPKIQKSVLMFIDEFYDLLNENEKEKFYAVVYEMLPEADSLSRALADVVDAHIEEERKEKTAKAIISAVEKDEKKSSPKLCAALVGKCGFTESVIAKKIFTDWCDKKTAETFITAAAAKPLGEMIETVTEVWTVVGEIKQETYEKYLSAINQKLNDGTRYDLFGLTDAADKINGLKESNAAACDFADKLNRETIYPAVSMMIPTCFDVKRYPDGVEKIKELGKTRNYITEAEEYTCVSEYEKMLEAAKGGNGREIIVHALGIPGKPVRQGAAVLLKKEINDADLNDENFLYFGIAVEYLRTDELKVSSVVNLLRDRKVKELRVADSKSSGEQLSEKADEAALACVMNSVKEIFELKISEEKKEELGVDFQRYLISFISRSKKGKKLISANIGEGASERYSEWVKKALETKPQGSSIFKKLFKK